MKLIYIANARLPTEKAHGIQIMKMCEAFADLGTDLLLIVPWRFNKIQEHPFEYYGVKRNFKIIKIPSLDLVRFGRLGFLLQLFSFGLISAIYLFFKKADFFYSRDEFPLFLLGCLGRKNLIWEVHTARKNFFAEYVLKKCKKIIAITQGLKKFYLQHYEINPDKILVAPDGVDLEEFDIKKSKEECRRKLNLPLDKKIILYSGHLYEENGVYILLQSAKYILSNLFIFVGGTDYDILKFKSKSSGFENILIIGRRPHKEIPLWLKAGDVLILPTSGKYLKEKYYVSSLKLFEYMASHRPIVASDLPSTREILSQNNSVLVKPDDPKALAEGIRTVLRNCHLSDKIVYQAFEDVKKYTWRNRARNILKI